MTATEAFVEVMGGSMGHVISFIGCVMGIFAAIDSNWDDAWNMPPLSYNQHNTQVANRLLFVIGCILCVVLDFTSGYYKLGSGMTLVVVPFLACFGLVLAWFCSFCAMRILAKIVWLANSLIGWIFEKDEK